MLLLGQKYDTAKKIHYKWKSNTWQVRKEGWAVNKYQKKDVNWYMLYV